MWPVGLLLTFNPIRIMCVQSWRKGVRIISTASALQLVNDLQLKERRPFDSDLYVCLIIRSIYLPVSVLYCTCLHVSMFKLQIQNCLMIVPDDSDSKISISS